MSKTARRLICGSGMLAVCVCLASKARAEDEAPKKSSFLDRIAGLVKKKEEPAPAEKEKEKPKSETKGESKSKSSGTAKTKSSDEPTKPKTTTASTTKKKSTAKPEPKEPAKKSSKSEIAKKESSVADKKKEEEKSGEKGKAGAKTAEAKPETKKDAEPEKKSEGKDKTSNEKKTASTTPESSKTTATQPSEASVSVDPPGRPMGGFAPGDERAVDVTSSNRAATVTTSGSAKLTEPPASANISNPLPPGKNAGWDIVKHEGRDYITAASIQRFYNFGTLKVDGNHVWLKAVNLILKAEIGSMEMLINNVKFILSYPVAESGGKVIFSRLDLCKLIDPVLRPSFIKDADPFDTVVLDAGHGGHDSGAKGVYGYEKDFTLKMAFVTKASLEKRGFKVIMTRSTDEFISRTGRVAIANKTPNSIFISLHFNSAGPAATGIETFALTPQGGSASLERGGGLNANGLTGNQQDSENIALATAVHAKVVSTYKLIDRGIKRAQWTVLTGCVRPGILFEGGFVTNGTECRFIASDTYRRALAETIGDAVVNYRKALTPATNMVKRR